jgi:hypothetical protein
MVTIREKVDVTNGRGFTLNGCVILHRRRHERKEGSIKLASYLRYAEMILKLPVDFVF